ncbi:hypothetical protein BDB00DRAFT_171629 [Zychaea mexicana]|uniref:uncharacterized protein n=1 Tax=Zychaea mexicana TaxID=64656 RepID=UPI0022FE15A9|nr:uncharacterized protein BDB00DRAFT_171629 [Zychaea mexicana]KAI9480232.1 hypothetical protein BDB00DRAFT_171629 [Zychaea mexicana]
MNSEQLAMAILQEKKQSQQQREKGKLQQIKKITDRKKKKTTKKQVKRMELKLKAQRLQVMSEIRKELRMKLKTNSECEQYINEVALEIWADTPSKSFQRGSYLVHWKTGALPNYSRHYCCTNTHGTIFHLLVCVDFFLAKLHYVAFRVCVCACYSF